MSHDSLVNWYTLNFNLMKHHHWSLTELDNLMPYERELYVLLLQQWLKEEKERREQEAQRNQ